MSDSKWTRRQALTSLSGSGVILASCREETPVDTEMRITAEILQAAQQVIGLDFTLPEREQMLKRANQSLEFFGNLREFSLDNSVPPAIQFDPVPRGSVPEPPAGKPAKLSSPIPDVPGRLEDLAYWPLSRLAPAVKARKVSSVDLTRLYLERLRKYDEKLECVISYTEKLALEQARRADRELARGRYRGPLHGIPWGAKDLLAVRGYRTTWGATSHRDQTLELDATVVRMLEDAGAVLIAKLSLGALAAVDVWYGGKTRNPWKLDEGSKGSSAGSAAATATGLVGFSIGSETMGSIVYPSATCGVTGLRPTFGRVSRHGAMTLSWSLDKLGPICRSAEDCALVFAAIHGLDPHDRTTCDRPFVWPVGDNLEGLRVGVAESLFQEQEEEAAKENDARSLEVFRSLGVDLVPIELPKRPLAPELILYTEAAAAFDEVHAEQPGRPVEGTGGEQLAQHVPSGPVRSGRRVHSGQPAALPVDGGHGPPHVRGRRLPGPQLQPERSAHQPDGAPQPLPAQWVRPRRPAHEHHLDGAPLRRVPDPGPGPSLPAGHRPSLQATSGVLICRSGPARQNLKNEKHARSS